MSGFFTLHPPRGFRLPHLADYVTVFTIYLFAWPNLCLLVGAGRFPPSVLPEGIMRTFKKLALAAAIATGLGVASVGQATVLNSSFGGPGDGVH